MNLDLKTKDGDRVCLSNHEDGLWLSVWLFRGHASVPITLKDATMLRNALNFFLGETDHE
jgi:hypothetical protein